MTNLHEQQNKRFVTVKELVNLTPYTWLSETSLRHHIFKSEPRYSSDGTKIPGNGLSKSILRIGRKILIDVNEFDIWLESHRAEPTDFDDEDIEYL